MTSIDITELRETVQRMEQHLQVNETESVRDLMTSYDQLKIRFGDDLEEERDVLLSCGGALMLIQQVAQRHTSNDSTEGR